MGDNVWTPERIQLVKRTVCPKGIPDDEFALFLEQCKRSELDPLIKEAYCVKRRLNVGTRERPDWVDRYEFQPSEAGMLARAERFPDFKGCTAGAVFADDVCEVDQGAGVVKHKYSPATRKGVLLGAWARVSRDGKDSIVVWLAIAGYVQETPLWRKIAPTMIEKCARVAALRKAYPSAFGGLYIEEELPSEETEQPARETQALPERTTIPMDLQPKAEKMKAMLRTKAGAEDAAKPEPRTVEGKRVTADGKPPYEHKARSDSIWEACKARGMTPAAFGGWTRQVLRTDSVKKIKDWTSDDMDHLEAALVAEAELAEQDGPPPHNDEHAPGVA